MTAPLRHGTGHVRRGGPRGHSPVRTGDRIILSPSATTTDAAVGDTIGAIIIRRPFGFTAYPITEDAAVGDIAGKVSAI